MESTISKWQKKLLLYLFNGEEQDGYIFGSIASPIPFESDDTYKIPADTFYQTTSEYFFRKWVLFEFLTHTLKFQFRLLGNALIGALAPMGGLIVLSAFFLSSQQFNEIVALINTKEGFQKLYEVGFIFAYGVYLINWVIRYSSNKATLVYLLQRNWLNFIQGKAEIKVLLPIGKAVAIKEDAN
ncbi:hypothetical protein [Neisseria yangbaofengii]|uniref:hypothetical protein n=1 Tax=Neisseria yangbaofengii TaxID=2709396 RepID=UPI0013EC301B|nr:hypothetical protein [Neisseria yangbaofengii]